MSPQSRMHRRARIRPPAEPLAGVDVAAAIARKEMILDEILAGVVTELAYRVRLSRCRTVRVTFDHRPWGSYARVDELDGERVVFEVTEGGWIALDEAEDLARLYAAARGLPVSRTDLVL